MTTYNTLNSLPYSFLNTKTYGQIESGSIVDIYNCSASITARNTTSANAKIYNIAKATITSLVTSSITPTYKKYTLSTVQCNSSVVVQAIKIDIIGINITVISSVSITSVLKINKTSNITAISNLTSNSVNEIYKEANINITSDLSCNISLVNCAVSDILTNSDLETDYPYSLLGSMTYEELNSKTYISFKTLLIRNIAVCDIVSNSIVNCTSELSVIVIKLYGSSIISSNSNVICNTLKTEYTSVSITNKSSIGALTYEDINGVSYDSLNTRKYNQFQLNAYINAIFNIDIKSVSVLSVENAVVYNIVSCKITSAFNVECKAKVISSSKIKHFVKIKFSEEFISKDNNIYPYVKRRVEV